MGVAAILIIVIGYWIYRTISSSSYKFWGKMQKDEIKAFAYFSSSSYWRVEANNIGNQKEWFGPFMFKSFDHRYYIYCKTDDVSQYWNDYLEFTNEIENKISNH